jgi:hypothetical protein
MSTATRSFWAVTGKSVIGASHVRRGQPNQDSIDFGETDCARIVSVADGHGSPRYFRSERGARLATQVAVKVLKDALDAGPYGLSQRLQEQVPQELVSQWQHAVAADLKENGFTPEELTLVAEKLRREVDDVVLEPLLAYGATMLAVLATDEFIFYLQLGDGDILTVSEDGAVSRPFPRDPRLLGNETTSLCMRNAVRHVKVRMHHADPQLPALVIVSTDGYSNSYANEDEFLRLGEDYWRLIHDDGFDSVSHNLEGWLAEVTSGASGDDITVALLFRPSAFAPQRPLGVRREEPKPARDEAVGHSSVESVEAEQGDEAPQATSLEYLNSAGPCHSSVCENSTGGEGMIGLDTAGAAEVLDDAGAGMHSQPPTRGKLEQEAAPPGSVYSDDGSPRVPEGDPTAVDAATSDGATLPSPRVAESYPQRRLFVGLYERPSRWKPRLPWKQNKDE